MSERLTFMEKHPVVELAIAGIPLVTGSYAGMIHAGTNNFPSTQIEMVLGAATGVFIGATAYRIIDVVEPAVRRGGEIAASIAKKGRKRFLSRFTCEFFNFL